MIIHGVIVLLLLAFLCYLLYRQAVKYDDLVRSVEALGLQVS